MIFSKLVIPTNFFYRSCHKNACPILRRTSGIPRKSIRNWLYSLFLNLKMHFVEKTACFFFYKVIRLVRITTREKCRSKFLCYPDEYICLHVCLMALCVCFKIRVHVYRIEDILT